MWWLSTLLIFLWFDIEWCLAISSFRPFLRYLSLYVFLPAAATLFSLAAALSRRWWIQASVSTVLTLLLMANLIYCRTYYVQIPLSSYALAGNLAGFTSSVTSSLQLQDLVFLLIILPPCFLSKKLAQKSRPQSLPVYFGSLAILCGLSYYTLAARGGFIERLDSLNRGVYDQQIATPVYTIFIPLLHEAITDSAPMTEQQKLMVHDWMMQHEKLTAQYSPDSVKIPDKLILVMIESMESWPIGTRVDGVEITPFLNSLVADSTVYFNPNVHTQVRDGRSIDGQILYIAGQFPLAKGVYSTKCVGNPYQTIAKAMKESGAETFLFSADIPITWNAAGIDRAFGIDSLYTGDILGLDAPSATTQPLDRDLYDATLRIMESHPTWKDDARAFGLIVTLTSHMPFNFVPEGEFDNLPGQYPADLQDYIKSMRYVDKSLKYLIESLRNMPNASGTTIAITGDHEGLASLRPQLAAKYSFVDPLTHTPLIIINSPYSGQDTKEIDQVDVYSALLDISGLYDSYPWKGMGRSPFDPDYSSTPQQHLDDAPYIGNLLLKYPESVNHCK